VSIDSTARPTVGRDAELQRLDVALEALDADTAGAIAVEGEPGIGKTRLLRELRDRAEARGHLVLAGSAAEFERSVPFSVWADAVGAAAAAEPLELVDRDDLAEILPSLRRPGSPASAVADERYRAHRAMRELLDVLARDRPLVVALDDLHWSDPASIDLVAALLRRGPSGAVLLVLAYRPGQAPERLTAALAAPAVQRIALAPLTEHAAAQLLGDVAADTGAIYRRAGGNPFYLEQLARFAPSGEPDAGADAGGGIPAAVAASLAEELAGLSGDERALLEGAAVAGEPFEPDLAAAVGELSLAAGLAALDALLARDLLRPTTVPRRFRFRHPLVRRAVYDATPGGWRLGAHARAADALAARGAATTELAHHVERSAAQGDEAAIAVLAAAGAATAPRAPAAAARWFQAALRLLPAAAVQRRIELLVALASAQRSLELASCHATLLEAIELLPADCGARRIELTALCAAVEHWLGRHEDAHRRLARAWEDLPDRSTAAAAALQIELAVDGLYVLDFEQSVAMGRGALELARALADRPLIAAAASALCLGEAAAGQVAAAREHRGAALAELDRLSDMELAPRLEALFYLGWAENYLEHWDAAIAHVDRGIAIARATGEGRLLVPMMLIKGYPFEFGGRLAEALAVSEAAVEASRLSGNDHYLFWSLYELGWAHYHAGDLQAAILAGEESARVGGRLAGGTMPASGGGPGWQLACARFEAGEVQAAWDIIHALGSDELEHKIPAERCIDWEIMALVELALGRPEAADRYIRRAERLAAELDLRLPTVFAQRGRAAVLLDAGEPLAAAQLAERAAAGADAAGARLVAAFARSLAGRALVAAGERAGAIAMLRAAESALDACGSLRVRDEMRRELRKLGARAEKRGPAAAGDSGVAALTKRELEIAGLVCDRRTNREIAATLFLSDKTVESHLRNIFAKLGVSSRVDVARAVERDRAAA
jgi:DNA-binding CsgD family transcriptional regulator